MVVNSLLCFCTNFRHEPRLEQLLAQFPAESRRLAQRTLLQLLPEGAAAGGPRPAALLQLLDRVNGAPDRPVFTAADLTGLPLRLHLDQAGLPKGLFDEMQHLHRYVQDEDGIDSEEADEGR